MAFVAKEVPPLGSAKFVFVEGKGKSAGSAQADENLLETSSLALRFNEGTGAISSLRWKPVDCGDDDCEGGDWEYVDEERQVGLNDYFHVFGKNPGDAKRNGRPTFRVENAGPLVASVTIESDAPGCNKLIRWVRVVDGLDRVEIADLVDKKEIPLKDLLKDDPTKEGFYIGFAFNVSNPEVRIDTPWAVVRPEKDQLEGACKNWFSVQRFVDVSGKDAVGKDRGVTWVSLDAPIMAIGEIPPQPAATDSREGWLKLLDPSATLYAFVMNNYWTTNYQHDQPGPKTFRFAIAPHGKYDPVQAARFGREQTQPLLVLPADPGTTTMKPVLGGVPEGLIVTTLKPVEEGEGLIVRLYNVSTEAVHTDCNWLKPLGKQLWLSDLGGGRKTRLERSITIPASQMLTVRVESGEERAE